MSEWKCYKLNEISSLSNGINFDKSAYTSGVKLIGVSDFQNRIHPDYDSLQEVDSKVVKNGDYLEKGDIVFVRSNGNKELVGRCMMIDKDIPVTYSGFCIKLRLKDKKIFDPVFFNYLFKTRQFKKSMTGTAVGANIQNLSQSRLGNCDVNVPDIDIQREIALILSRYDSLIENYQKQIKLLEEAAQRLYKEWFVDLHFPGHENTKIVDGVPEGWEKRPIGDVVVYYDKQRKPLSSMQRMNMEKIYPYYGAAALMDYVDSYLFDGIYLLLGEDGTVITPDNFPVLQYVWGKFWVNNHAHVLRGKDGISTEFLYSMFKEMPIADVVTGAAQPKISQGRLSDKKILMPSLKLIQEWSCIAKHYFGRIRMITEQIRLLTEARDRLLPKLMNGEIELEGEKRPERPTIS